MTRQPSPPDPSWPRYSKQPFPAYRYVPGLAPHPRRDPQGHSYGQPEPKPAPVAPEAWRTCEPYLYGIDLFDFGYWWECHEQLEGLWHAVGHETPQGQFLQGIVQVAAANLQRFRGVEETAHELALKGLERHRGLPPVYMGCDLAGFDRQVNEYYSGVRPLPPLIRLSE